MRLSLRPYQERGLIDIRASFGSRRRAVLYVLPTGGGKTVTYAAIAEGAAKLGKRVLILEHRKELIRQASLALGGIGVPHRIVSPPGKVAAIRRAHVAKLGWSFVDPNAAVAVASVQTLAGKLEWLAEFAPDLIVVDEAHHAVAGTWARILAACPAARVLGVTATPCRTNGQGLGDVFDVMVLGPSPKELIGDGYLLAPRVVAPPVRADLSQVKRGRNGDLDADSLAEAMMASREITGDAVEHYTRLAPGRPAIVFAANLKHAAAVAEQFREAGYRFEVVHGTMDDTERDRLIYGLADGSLHGLVTKDLISEGTDIPVAEVAIMLRLTDSESLFLQQAGRVLRPVYAPGFDLAELDGRHAAIAASGKPYGLILDHVGNCGRVVNGEFAAKHGLPHDDRPWSLEGRKKKGKAAAQEDAVVARQCPHCYAVHEPADAAEAGRDRARSMGLDLASARPECPSCGFVYPVRAVAPPEQVEGTLVDVSDLAATEALRDAARRRAAQSSARTLEQLTRVTGNEKRARHILEAREEKDRLQAQVRDLLTRWFEAAGRPQPAARAVEDKFGFASTAVRSMKPKALREAVERVTEELLRLQLGAAPANDGAFSIRASR